MLQTYNQHLNHQNFYNLRWVFFRKSQSEEKLVILCTFKMDYE